MFDTENIPQLIKTYKEKWEEFRQVLVNKELKDIDLERLKKETFLSVIDNMLKYEKDNELIKVPFSKLYRDYTFCRATKIDKDRDIEPLPFKRFLPNKQYINDDNRFSPKNVEYLYLACNEKIIEERNYKYIEEVALKEVRAKKGEVYGVCKFRIPEKLNGSDKNIINLTISDNKSIYEIQEEFIKEYKKIRNYLTIYATEEQKKQQYKATEIFVLKIYFYFMSQELFKPVKSDDKSNQYVPFHCIAKYFKQLGYDGIMYKSTVCNNRHGKNIVLFDKYYAEPFEYRLLIKE
ncbi:hypothetical protein AB2T96_10060 [Clostridium butyricum]|uniref:hypothetical protein n=1 Tax=Clostridium butyricum TaxID=1492 RepID=UPI0034663C8B